jgi:hypothetical protein
MLLSLEIHQKNLNFTKEKQPKKFLWTTFFTMFSLNWLWYHLLGIGLQKQYCTVKNKISKSKNEFMKNRWINTYLNVFKNKQPFLGYIGKIKLLAPRLRTCDEPSDLLTNDWWQPKEWALNLLFKIYTYSRELTQEY